MTDHLPLPGQVFNGTKLRCGSEHCKAFLISSTHMEPPYRTMMGDWFLHSTRGWICPGCNKALENNSESAPAAP